MSGINPGFPGAVGTLTGAETTPFDTQSPYGTVPETIAVSTGELAYFAAAITQFPTIDALRDSDSYLEAPEGLQVFVGGYHTEGDGGSGAYYWDPDSVTSDNNGTVIQPNSNADAGRWLFLNLGLLNVKNFGAVGDGVADDSAAFAGAAAVSSYVYVPSGTYLLNAQQPNKFWGPGVLSIPGVALTLPNNLVRREVLTTGRTYFVRTDGNDSNSGRSNSATGAFATIQKAADVVHSSIDLGGFNVTVTVGNGVYAAGVRLFGPFTGLGAVTFSCAASIGSVVVQGVWGFDAENGAGFYVVGGFDFQTSSIPIIARGQSRLYFSGIQVNDVPGAPQLYSNRQSYLEAIDTFYVNGSAGNLVQSSHHGNFRMGTGNITFQKDCTFTQVLYAEENADITFTGTAAFVLNAHTITGTKGWVQSNSAIQWSSKTYSDFPGSLPAIETTNGRFSFGASTSQSEQGNWAGTQTYDLSTSSGTVVVTGLGFMPTMVEMTVTHNTFGTGTSGAIGHAKIIPASGVIFQQSLLYTGIIVAGTWSASSAAIFIYYDNAGGTNYVTGTITAVSSDGFTITMAKTGTPTSVVRLLMRAWR